MYASINGQLVEEQYASLSVRDAAFLHAAAVFTTMRADGLRVFRLTHHLARLRHSCQALGITLRVSDADLALYIQQLLHANQCDASRVRLTLTRGAPGQDASAIVTASRFQPYPSDLYENGMPVILTHAFRLNAHDLTAGHKTTNYLGRLAALDHARSQAAHESLWLDTDGYLQSGSISNVFIVRCGRLLTPPTNQDLADPAVRQLCRCTRSAVLPGITRQLIFELAAGLSLDCRPATLLPDELAQANECFLTNSLMGIMPVRSLDHVPIGPSAPGPLTRHLTAAYARALAT